MDGGFVKKIRPSTRLPRTLSASAILLLFAGAPGGCGGHDPDPYQPLTEACDACLREPGSTGCGDTYQACIELASCESLVLCELNQQCYFEPSSSDCAAARGCETDIGSSEAELADSFEACARSTCREACDFAE